MSSRMSVDGSVGADATDDSGSTDDSSSLLASNNQRAEDAPTESENYSRREELRSKQDLTRTIVQTVVILILVYYLAECIRGAVEQFDFAKHISQWYNTLIVVPIEHVGKFLHWLVNWFLIPIKLFWPATECEPIKINPLAVPSAVTDLFFYDCDLSPLQQGKNKDLKPIESSLELFVFSLQQWRNKHLEPIDWNLEFQYGLKFTGVAGVFMLLDVLFSKEKYEGNRLLLFFPFLAFVEYAIITVHVLVTGKLDLSKLFDLSTVAEAAYTDPEDLMLITLKVYYALDPFLWWLVLKDFYKRVASRNYVNRLLVAGIILLAAAFGPGVHLVYLALRCTRFTVLKDTSPRLPANQSRLDRLRENLWDPVPPGGGGIPNWLRVMPSPFHIPFFLAAGVLGVVRFVGMLLLYFVYVVFYCMPYSALFVSSWRKIFEAKHGAYFTPFETVAVEKSDILWFLRLKAVLARSGHLRLWCFKNKNNWLFNWTIGFWLRPLLEAFIMYEFTIPFQSDFTPYCAFMMEEFGDVFPMGDGLGFGKYTKVQSILENPDLLKGRLSLGWQISTAQGNFCKINLTQQPQTQDQANTLHQGRALVKTWLADVNHKLELPKVRHHLDTILPFPSINGEMMDRTAIEMSFGSALFHLLTGGDLTIEERKGYYNLIVNAFPFFSDWINKVWGGGLLEYTGMQDYERMRQAVLRYADAPNLLRALEKAEENEWEAWTPPVIVRMLVTAFSIAGGAAPALLLGDIVETFYKDEKVLNEFKGGDAKKRRLIILEIARLKRCVPLVNTVAKDFKLPGGKSKTVKIFGQEVHVPDGSSLHCSIQNANRDVTIFGEDAEEINIDRSYRDIAKMLTFNGSYNHIDPEYSDGGAIAPRHCPGWSYALSIIDYLALRYVEHQPAKDVMDDFELKQLKKKQSTFQSLLLYISPRLYTSANLYFPYASDAKHPMDGDGEQIGSIELIACGKRTIPTYDEDQPLTEKLLDKLQGYTFKFAPLTDDEGEWEEGLDEDGVDQAVRWRRKVFNVNFPESYIDYSRYIDKNNMEGVVEQIAFAGLGYFHTKKRSDFDEDSLVLKHWNLIAFENRWGRKAEAVYATDTSILGPYKVRPGFQQYGAIAYFDVDKYLLGIYACYDEKLHINPKYGKTLGEIDALGEVELAPWRHAMWAWRVSMSTLSTVVDHLTNVHMIDSNTLVKSSRSNLPMDHPLRAFLKIFTFRTIAINGKAFDTLIRPKGVINRAWALDGQALQDLLMRAPNKFKKILIAQIPESMRDVDIDLLKTALLPGYTTFIRRISKTKILKERTESSENGYKSLMDDAVKTSFGPLADEKPYKSPMGDLVRFYGIIWTMVHDVLHIFYDGPKTSNETYEYFNVQMNMKNDKDLQNFLEGLSAGLGLQKEEDFQGFEDVVDVLSSLICSVTGIHELVGHVTDYFSDPRISGSTIRVGTERDSMQKYQLSCALISATGLRMPRLLANWSCLLTRHRFAEETVPVMRKLQKGLEKLALDIEGREEKENPPNRFQFNSLNPHVLDSSVSI